MNNKGKEEGFDNFSMNDFLGKHSGQTLPDKLPKQSEDKQQATADEADKLDNVDSLHAVNKPSRKTEPSKQRKLNL